MVKNLKYKDKGLSPEIPKILDLRGSLNSWRPQQDISATLELYGTGCTLAVSPVCHDPHILHSRCWVTLSATFHLLFSAK